MPSRRAVGFSLAIGVIHAAGVLLVALSLGYSIGPSQYSLGGLLWRYGGLVVVAAVPVWLAVRFHLVTPVLALVLTTAYVLGVALTPPGPTFRDVAELERLAEPTGIIVVENGLYNYTAAHGEAAANDRAGGVVTHRPRSQPLSVRPRR